MWSRTNSDNRNASKKNRIEFKQNQSGLWAHTEGQRAWRCDRPALKKNNSAMSLDREIVKTGNLPKKLVIDSQNPEPYSFLKLPLFIDGYFNSQLKTFLNIH
ncbi:MULTISPECIES: hypothetical protein [unclassified Microcoleus]|uniref:hypothetical protein n=1 Tax=unclassified Microcoleus TaxID=2642155 RepID=UPI002FD0F93F